MQLVYIYIQLYYIKDLPFMFSALKSSIIPTSKGRRQVIAILGQLLDLGADSENSWLVNLLKTYLKYFTNLVFSAITRNAYKQHCGNIYVPRGFYLTKK